MPQLGENTQKNREKSIYYLYISDVCSDSGNPDYKLLGFVNDEIVTHFYV